VTKPELGTKRLCASCGAKFFDLIKAPITCPKCGAIFQIVPVTSRPRTDQARGARKPEAKVPQEENAEPISLEDADPEGQEKKAPAEDTLIEEEEEDTDVSEIIGGDIESEKEP
jgi:uncharacterized protein (TIGR02300 family)